MVEVYFIRHGESIVNITKEFSYKIIDKSLTEKGKLQAVQLANYLKDIEFSSIYTSPLKRAFETAQTIHRFKKVPLIIMEQFREINVGELEKLNPTEENWKQYFKVINSWASGNNERRFPQGENKVELLNRFKDGMRTILAENHRNPVCVVGHGGIFILSLLDILENITPDFIKNRPFWPNCGITICDISLKDSKISGTLQNFGNISFLKDFAADMVDGIPDFLKK